MKIIKLATVIGATTAALVLAAAPALADSGIIYSGGGSDCAGYWNSGTDEFLIKDRAGGNDNDYCYIEYGPTEQSADRRLTIEEDSQIGYWQEPVGQPEGLSGFGPLVYFRVCEERENDPDLCSNTVGYPQ